MTDEQSSIKQVQKKLYTDAGLDKFRQFCIKLSKLLAQAWIKEDGGNVLAEGIRKHEKELHELLEDQGIFLPPAWTRVELATDSFQGEIKLDESSLKEGLTFVWRIPYAPRPTEGITDEEIREWIKKCDEWLKREEFENPDAPFPTPNNPYIPLATL